MNPNKMFVYSVLVRSKFTRKHWIHSLKRMSASAHMFWMKVILVANVVGENAHIRYFYCRLLFVKYFTLNILPLNGTLIWNIRIFMRGMGVGGWKCGNGTSSCANITIYSIIQSRKRRNVQCQKLIYVFSDVVGLRVQRVGSPVRIGIWTLFE